MVGDHIVSSRLYANEMNKGTLYKATVSLIRGHVNLSSLARELNLSYHWLHRLKNGHVSQPDVNRIEQVYVYLSGASL